MDLRLIIITGEAGVTYPRTPPPTSTSIEGLSTLEASDLRGRLARTIFAFEEELRSKRRARRCMRAWWSNS